MRTARDLLSNLRIIEVCRAASAEVHRAHTTRGQIVRRTQRDRDEGTLGLVRGPHRPDVPLQVLRERAFGNETGRRLRPRTDTFESAMGARLPDA